jgi:arginase
MKNHWILTPFFLDQPRNGLNHLLKPGWEINSPALPAGELQNRMSVYHEPLADFVATTVTRGERPVSLAGDCCSAIAVLAGLQRAGIDPVLIWFDAHGDLNTWETTPSGFLGGMPLAMLLGQGEQTLPEAVGLKNIPEDRVILSDGRDLDPGEKELLQHSRLTHFPNTEALLSWPIPDSPLYIHFDTDVVCPEQSPAQNYLAPGGPTAEMLRAVFLRLAQTHRVAAVSISSWNPELDPDRKSERVSLSLVETLLGTD